MTKIKQLKDTTGNFYPVTHKDAVVGIEDIQVDMTGYATEQWVEELNYLKARSYFPLVIKGKYGEQTILIITLPVEDADGYIVEDSVLQSANVTVKNNELVFKNARVEKNILVI